MPIAQFEPIHLQDGDYVSYFLRDTPHPSFCMWMIPGTWRGDEPEWGWGI